jgi:hypothetical protein
MLNYDWFIVKNSVEDINDDVTGEKGTFSQPGWYVSSTDVALLYTENGHWWLYVWNGRDPRKIMEQLVTLPEFAG